MIHELETMVSNLIVALSKKDISKYPLLEVYRHHMRLVVDQDDQLHELFENLDFANTDLIDLLNCSGAEFVKLHDNFYGLRLNQFSPDSQEAVYWISAKDSVRGQSMSELYDSVKAFLTSIPEEKRPNQRIALGECGGLVTWTVVQRHIANNPRDVVFGCLAHPNRFFTPSPGLYVKIRDAKGDIVVPSLDYVSQTDIHNEEPTWFTVGKTVRNSIVL